MARPTKKQTKRNQERLVQAWFDTQNPDDKEALRVLDMLRDKYDWTVKQTVANSLIIAAQSKGIEVDTPLTMTQINRMFKKIMTKMDKLVASGQLSAEQAARISPMFEDNLRYEDFDAIAKSLTGNYTGFQLADEDEE